jgi:hypothetical protein
LRAQTSAAGPRPDFRASRFLLGTWACRTVERNPYPGRPDGRVETRVIGMALDDRWLYVTSSHAASGERPHVVAKTWITWDAGAGQWVQMGIDALGGYGVATSNGWQGDHIVWTDKMAPAGRPVGASTLTKISDVHFTDTYVVRGETRNQTYADDCQKQM